MDFFREGLNLIAGLVLGGVGYVITNLIALADVSVGAITALQATYFAIVVFALIFLGTFLAGVGQKAYDARSSATV